MMQFSSGRFYAHDGTGAPLVGGRLYTYESGTTDFKAAFSDATGNTPATYTSDGMGGQYIQLNARGEAQVWPLDGAYSMVLQTPAGATIWTVDGVRGEDEPDVTAATGGITIPDFQLTKAAPATRRIEFPATNPNGWNLASGAMTVELNFRSNSYLAENPSGHLIFGLRVDTAVLSTETRFHGMVLNRLTGINNGAPYYPATQLETAAVGLAPGGIRALLPNTWPPSDRPLLDAVDYKAIIESKVLQDGNLTLRYRLWKSDAPEQAWDLMWDSGDVYDANSWLDRTQQGFVIASVFEDATVVDWTVDFANCRITWGPAMDAGTDMSALPDLSSVAFDGNLDGNLNIEGSARYITGKMNGATLGDWMAFKTNLANNSSTVAVVPDGSSTAANFLAGNKQTRTGSWAWTSVGMNGTRGYLETFGLGGHVTPEFDINIGGVTKATFTATGLKMAGATEVIGTTSTRLLGPTNLGGANALALSSAFDFETLCTAGAIASFLGGTYSASNIENIARPLYCYMSQFLADFKARKNL